ncbi:tyrosine--tRNA ligase [Candidatus Kuenenbacteria bacterium RIFCSPHIGHO2_02_FULL_39_13]|uniref:Tyrosine--tRNA ligase n=1 Tax=Candidatus Kuenenbacteria bacterium RIFCSPHIGHO2_02_FULL_39_13 TaxID=1798561 RepID=A0A1F6FLT0_9BACT|nr:MAG: tyrosine--tRNA ligase [Candidatus Kuenenbacteria bacterium RIFCSPHIGHO2_02_FULL_39_13]
MKELLEKGVESIYPDKSYLEKLLESDKKLTVYQGFDPTADTLHIGSSVGLIKLKQFQDLGHHVVFLIGDYTAMIGDPDKRTVRKQLTYEQVIKNCKNYQAQASKILNFSGKNPVQLKYNSEWLSKLTFKDTLELLTNFTVQRILERDLFEQRIKSGNPLYLHEFMYPVMQAYDSLVMNVDGEIGGNDQTFNMLTGRDLMAKMKNKEKFVLTMKLLEDPSGKKMGKTEGNMITLNNSPKDMFGKIMSWPDTMIALGFELCTNYSMDEVAEIKEKLTNQKTNPRDLKAELAKEIITCYHSKAEADKAEQEFNRIFRDKNTPTNMEKVFIMNIEYDLPELMVSAQLVPSKSEAKRLIEQGGVTLDNKKITDWKNKIKPRNGDILKIGKRKFARLIIK